MSREMRAYVPVERIHSVVAKCIEHNLAEFSVHDDRGGTGMWQVIFWDTSRKEIREIVGPGIHVEPV